MEDKRRGQLPQRMPIWLERSEQVIVETEHAVECSAGHSCVLEVFIGRCTAWYGEDSAPLSARSLVYLCRGERLRLVNQDENPCRLIILWLVTTDAQPCIDLRRLCLKYPSVDDFFIQKPKMCVMADKAQVYLSIGDIQNEHLNAQEDSPSMLRPMLEVLYLRLARCLRHPSHSTGVNYMIKAKAYINAHLQTRLMVGDIAAHTGVSKSYLENLFRIYMDKSVVEFIQSARCYNAANMLASTTFPIIEVAIDSGFNNRQHFARVFSALYGMSPGQYRKAHQEKRGEP